MFTSQLGGPFLSVPWLMSGLVSLYGRSRLANRLPPIVNVAISNVPGPQFPLYFAGARLASFFPVSIPGHGTNKINSALTFGGPALTIKTIERLTGIHIDYYLLTWFGGLAHMVNDVGGIVVDVPYPMHDSYSGADFNAGVQRLNGKQALAFSRNRHDTPLGDLSRSQNQGILLMAALRQFHEDFAKDQGEESLDAFRSKVRQQLLEHAQQEADLRVRQGLLDLVIERNPIDLPPALKFRRPLHQARHANPALVHP